VLITAEELNLDYQYIAIDITTAEHKSATHLARHPLGKVPVLELDGDNYIESNSICRFLAEKNDCRLYASDISQRAHINEWIDMVALHIGRWMTTLYFEAIIKPKLFSGATNQENIDEALAFLAQQLPTLDAALAKNAFIVGETLTIADIITFSYCQTHEFTHLDFDNYPHIKQWYQNINARPSVARAMQHFPLGNILPA
jgi:glutathione S-transferase